MAHAELGNIVQKSESLQKPNDYRNHDNAIQDALDLTLHGNEAVYQPKQDADDGECDNKSDEWHVMFSSGSLRTGRHSGVIRQVSAVRVGLPVSFLLGCLSASCSCGQGSRSVHKTAVKRAWSCIAPTVEKYACQMSSLSVGSSGSGQTLTCFIPILPKQGCDC